MRKNALLIFVLASLVACTDQEKQSSAKQEPAEKVEEVENRHAEAIVKRGRDLFLKNCAVCHGMNAEGAPGWTQRSSDGKLPAPPLNGTGHAWHHPKQALVYTIKNGTIALGGSMPPWKDKLSDDDINAIIAWFQSQWPQEIYTAWQRLDSEAQRKK